jgi:hypothetical protein
MELLEQDLEKLKKEKQEVLKADSLENILSL